MGLVDDETWSRYQRRREQLHMARSALEGMRLNPSEDVVARLSAAGICGFRQPASAWTVLSRPDASWDQLARAAPLPAVDAEVAGQLEVEAKYGGYIQRAERRAAEAERMEAVPIPSDLGWLARLALSTEVRERVERARPVTLGQLARLPGITPAAVGAVAAWLASAQRDLAHPRR
jgi:tRNA uridine 5-carboxymethylaminomethyl modification enzyme